MNGLLGIAGLILRRYSVGALGRVLNAVNGLAWAGVVGRVLEVVR